MDPLADSTIEMVVSKVLDFKILILFRGITTQDVKGRRTDGQFFLKKIIFLILFLKNLYPVARWGRQAPFLKFSQSRHIFLKFFYFEI